MVRPKMLVGGLLSQMSALRSRHRLWCGLGRDPGGREGPQPCVHETVLATLGWSDADDAHPKRAAGKVRRRRPVGSLVGGCAPCSVHVINAGCLRLQRDLWVKLPEGLPTRLVTCQCAGVGRARALITQR